MVMISASVRHADFPPPPPGTQSVRHAFRTTHSRSVVRANNGKEQALLWHAGNDQRLALAHLLNAVAGWGSQQTHPQHGVVIEFRMKVLLRTMALGRVGRAALAQEIRDGTEGRRRPTATAATSRSTDGTASPTAALPAAASRSSTSSAATRATAAQRSTRAAAGRRRAARRSASSAAPLQAAPAGRAAGADAARANAAGRNSAG